MINLKNLKLYPYVTKDLAISNTTKDIPYTVIMYPENVIFQSTYPKLNIRRQFVSNILLPQSTIMKQVISKDVVDSYRKLNLIPLRDIEKSNGNIYVDMGGFLNKIDKRFGSGNYKRGNIEKIILNKLLGYKRDDRIAYVFR